MQSQHQIGMEGFKSKIFEGYLHVSMRKTQAFLNETLKFLINLESWDDSCSSARWRAGYIHNEQITVGTDSS